MFCCIHMRALSQEVFVELILNMVSWITLLNLLPHFPGLTDFYSTLAFNCLQHADTTQISFIPNDLLPPLFLPLHTHTRTHTHTHIYIYNWLSGKTCIQIFKSPRNCDCFPGFMTRSNVWGFGTSNKSNEIVRPCLFIWVDKWST